VDVIRGGAAELRGEEARHLTRVLRVEPGQCYEISDNTSAWLAEVQEARGEHVVFRVLQPVESTPLPVRITLFAAIIKFDRFEWIVEKATELGVERIVPVDTARVEKGLFEASRKRSERWARIARESSQQSRRVQVPEISPAVRLAMAVAEPFDHRFFLEEVAAPALLTTIPQERDTADRVGLLLGPEGGWTNAERELAAAAGWQAVSLSPQVLRAETAAAAAVAIVLNAWMR
jgi:16S rRNA (uracil1498-N3)-methyltransferase